MEAIFQKSHYPEVHVVDKLSDKLGLSIERISVWFQNRRAKYKKTKRPSGSTYVDTSALHANNLFSMASSASQSQQIYGRSLSDPTSSSSFTLARANVDRATTATKECDDNDEEENEDENTSDIEIMAAASSNNRSSNNSSNSFISDNDNRGSNSSNSSISSSRYATVNADINSQVSSSNEHINSSSINQSTTPLM